jgi:hypothetical protein
MSDTILIILLSVIGVLLLATLVLQALFLFRKKSPPKVQITSNIENMRSIGELSVFRVLMKEIVTETDHSWGGFGKKYLSWVLSSKKMAMIFEFDIDFRYDLRSSECRIDPSGPGAYTLKMPPCFYRVSIRDIRFYDEQRARFLPWLLPDLLNAFSNVGFGEEDKNRLVEAAKGHAEDQAKEMISRLKGEVETSAKQTLELVGKALGAKQITFQFKDEPPQKLSVDYNAPAENAA